MQLHILSHSGLIECLFKTLGFNSVVQPVGNRQQQRPVCNVLVLYSQELSC